jgi:drug/metabolite transporter (DMT)-like permease
LERRKNRLLALFFGLFGLNWLILGGVALGWASASGTGEGRVGGVVLLVLGAALLARAGFLARRSRQAGEENSAGR